MSYLIGQIITSKKVHPCGNREWKIVRTGADFKLECTGCKRVILLDKNKLDKITKK